MPLDTTCQGRCAERLGIAGRCRAARVISVVRYGERGRRFSRATRVGLLTTEMRPAPSVGVFAKVGECLAYVLLVGGPAIERLPGQSSLRQAIGDEVDDMGNGNTQSADSGASGRDVRDVGDPIVCAGHDVLLLIFQRRSSAEPRRHFTPLKLANVATKLGAVG
jgi:hypothetical protein